MLAGRETPGSGQYWSRIITPVLLVHGDADYNVTYGDGRRAYAGAPPPRFLLTVLGGDHGAPYSGDAGDPQAALVSDAILDSSTTRLQARASAPGVAKLELELSRVRLPAPSLCAPAHPHPVRLRYRPATMGTSPVTQDRPGGQPQWVSV